MARTAAPATVKHDPKNPSRACYQAGCQTVACREANAAYRRERYSAVRDGDVRTPRASEPTVPVSTRVSVERAGEITELQDTHGLSFAAAAREALYRGLDSLHGRRRRG